MHILTDWGHVTLLELMWFANPLKNKQDLAVHRKFQLTQTEGVEQDGTGIICCYYYNFYYNNNSNHIIICCGGCWNTSMWHCKCKRTKSLLKESRARQDWIRWRVVHDRAAYPHRSLPGTSLHQWCFTRSKIQSVPWNATTLFLVIIIIFLRGIYSDHMVQCKQFRLRNLCNIMGSSFGGQTWGRHFCDQQLAGFGSQTESWLGLQWDGSVPILNVR